MLRRMKMNKQMLGNIEFIGELYRNSLIREHMIHYSILVKFDINKENRIIDDDDNG